MRGFQHQTHTSTRTNRYPNTFAAVQDYFGQDASINILSYGCSTGEECQSLATIFPNASIIGCDINKKVLREATTQNKLENIRFVPSDADILRKLGPFDAVFAMAVLCRWPRLKYKNESSNIYSFHEFSQGIDLLDELLARDGIFAINNASYFFEDTHIMNKYQILETVTLDPLDEDIVKRFTPDNLVDTSSRIPSSLFIKIQDIL